MDINGSPTATIEINNFKGQNTAVQFSQIDINQSPDMRDLIPGKTGSLKNRAGSKLVTTSPIPNPFRLFPYFKSSIRNLVATSGVTLYKFNPNTLVWNAQTMTNNLLNADVNAVQFRDANANEVMVIADGSSLKYFDDVAVKNITPATSDTLPLPPNALATINSGSPAVGITTHNNRLVIWTYRKDTIFHSKPGFYDYFPQTSFQRWVRDSDYIQTCVSFGASLLVFMRRHIGVLFNDGYSSTPQAIDWSQDFLDTTDGCVNPRSVQIVTYPDGSEQAFYQTDRGVSAVVTINTMSLDSSARFATRSVTNNKLDWNALGVTNTEWAQAISYFTDGKYWLIYYKGGVYQGLVYNTNNDEWYPVSSLAINDFYADETGFYFIGSEGHLHKFDPTLTKDYTDYAMTTGINVNWYWYSKLMNPQMTGFNHFWDILMIEAQQFLNPSTIDIEVNTANDQFSLKNAIKTSIMVVGVSVIGDAQIANTLLTDIVNNAKRVRMFVVGQYCQIKLSSDRGEPVELFDIKIETRPQQTYG